MNRQKTFFNIFVTVALVLFWLGVAFATYLLWVVSDVFRLLGGGVLLYVFIAIYIISLVLPFVLRQWMEEYFSMRAKFVVSSLLAVIVAGVVFVGAVSYISEFTPKKWANNEPLRVYMIDDLEDEYLVTGKTNEEIKELLGEPKYVYGNEEMYEYYVGDSLIDPYGYQITFENGTSVDKKLIEH